MDKKKRTVADIIAMKGAGEKISMLTAYDACFASILDQSGIEIILVGDSLGMVMLGYESTIPVTMDEMIHHAKAARRGVKEALLVGDMPFLSYQTCIADAVRNAGRFVQEAGAQIIKIEITGAYLDVIKAVSDAGMSVMAHIGIRPQSITRLGRLKAEGTTAELAYELVEQSEAMVRAGANSLLLEGTAREVAKIVTEKCPVPVISCGSGPDCDGQVLVLADILGLSSGPLPKFSRRFADLDTIVVKAVEAYAEQIRDGRFPDDTQCYHIKSGELNTLTKMLGNTNR